MNTIQKKWEDWDGSIRIEVLLPINKIIDFYEKYISKKEKKDYEWEYDKQFGECECKASPYSDPYCKHFNRLRRIEK